MQTNAGEEEGDEQFGNALRKIVHPVRDRLGQRHAGQKGSDDGSHSRIDRQYARAKSKTTASANCPSEPFILRLTAGSVCFTVLAPHRTTIRVNPMARTAVDRSSSALTVPLATLLTSASMRSPRTSSMMAAAMMMRLALSWSRPFAAKTCAVIPTLVATRAAPVNTASIFDPPQSQSNAKPARKGAATHAHQQSRSADSKKFGRLHLEAHAEEEK